MDLRKSMRTMRENPALVQNIMGRRRKKKIKELIICVCIIVFMCIVLGIANTQLKNTPEDTPVVSTVRIRDMIS